MKRGFWNNNKKKGGSEGKKKRIKAFFNPFSSESLKVILLRVPAQSRSHLTLKGEKNLKKPNFPQDSR